MSPGPKTEADQKIERNINGIVFTVLAIIAVVLLAAALFFYKGGRKIVPKNRPAPTVQNSPAPR